MPCSCSGPIVRAFFAAHAPGWLQRWLQGLLDLRGGVPEPPAFSPSLRALVEHPRQAHHALGCAMGRSTTDLTEGSDLDDADFEACQIPCPVMPHLNSKPAIVPKLDLSRLSSNRFPSPAFPARNSPLNLKSLLRWEDGSGGSRNLDTCGIPCAGSRKGGSNHLGGSLGGSADGSCRGLSPGAPLPQTASRRGKAGPAGRNCDVTAMCDEFEEEFMVLEKQEGKLTDDEVMVPNEGMPCGRVVGSSNRKV